ncbi:MAG: hypothetical protein JRH20_13040 [Deltaproteobacteria bacterium]|nr:hypothetical protein [Deltaproteobacteria bacterium]
MRVPSLLLVLLLGGCHWIAAYGASASPDGSSTRDSRITEGGISFDASNDARRDGLSHSGGDAASGGGCLWHRCFL